MKTHAATPRGEPIVSPVGRNGHSTKPHINLIGVRDSFCLSLACLGKLGVLNSNFFSNAEASRQLLLGFRTATASGAVPRGDLHKLNHVHESQVSSSLVGGVWPPPLLAMTVGSVNFEAWSTLWGLVMIQSLFPCVPPRAEPHAPAL
jgi:hypothetical protein